MRSPGSIARSMSASLPSAARDIDLRAGSAAMTVTCASVFQESRRLRQRGFAAARDHGAGRPSRARKTGKLFSWLDPGFAVANYLEYYSCNWQMCVAI